MDRAFENLSPNEDEPALAGSAEDPIQKMESDSLLWGAVVTDPSTGVSVMDRDGLILYINQQSIRIFFEDDRTPADVVGKTLSQLGFPDEWVAERIGIARDLIDSRESILLRTVWHGHQQFSWMRSIEGDRPGHNGRVLVITRRVVAGNESEHLLQGEYEVIKSNVVGLGKLDTLTTRELEVLALVGQGMSTREIADTLFRSSKTVENHRESISKKLGRVKGVELARIAREAGLQPSDHDRTRV